MNPLSNTTTTIINNLKSIMGDDKIYIDISNKTPQDIAVYIPKMYTNKKVILFAFNNGINVYFGFPLHKFIAFHLDNYVSLESYKRILDSKLAIMKSLYGICEDDCCICLNNAIHKSTVCMKCAARICEGCVAKLGKNECPVCRSSLTG